MTSTSHRTPGNEPWDARDGAKFADLVARQIRSEVVARGWPVGEVIGTEPELVERFGASRATLREALRIVEYLGIARMRQGPGGGLVVMAPDPSAITFAAVIYLAYSRVSVQEVLAARRVIEELAIELAVARCTPADRQRLAEHLAELGERPSELATHWELHGDLGAMTANPVVELFVQILSRLTAQYAASGRRSQAQATRERLATHAAHGRIVHAVTIGDAVLGRMAMRHHLEEIESFVVSRKGRQQLSIGDPLKGFPGAKLGTVVAVSMLTEIAEAGWQVGELLGSEATLMERHDVSRAVIREAVRLLEFHHVVRTRRGPGGGVFVTAPSLDAVTDALVVHLEYRGVDRHHLFEVRNAIELETVHETARACDEATVAELRSVLEQERASGPERVGTVSQPLHAAIADVAGNRAMSLLLGVLVRLTAERGNPAGDEASEQVFRVHAAIVSAIAAGDAPTARRRMERHLAAMKTLVR
jgi:DNA-binding FadR family transcriptional regulator